MNEIINDEAVYRTAPATPGLLVSRRRGTRSGIWWDDYCQTRSESVISNNNPIPKGKWEVW